MICLVNGQITVQKNWAKTEKYTLQLVYKIS